MQELTAELDRCAASGRQVTFWLRDDDAIAATPALMRLLGLAGDWDVPLVLAVIPQPAQPDLARVLTARTRVAVHGFAHLNHAPAGEKKQELGAHRPAETVLEELGTGRERLASLFPGHAVPMLVPPWNRIAPGLIPHLPRLGFRTLSSFGPAAPHQPAPGLTQADCQLDIIDWRTRRTHPPGLLAGRLAALVRERAPAPAPIGILTHHLVHDGAAWDYLSSLFRLTARHEAATWVWPVP